MEWGWESPVVIVLMVQVALLVLIISIVRGAWGSMKETYKAISEVSNHNRVAFGASMDRQEALLKLIESNTKAISSLEQQLSAIEMNTRRGFD